ncbi:hypothetical protein HN371_24745 [Candidatus Poribacteria bacterium]|jgi:hypothetical protein|nr:hypothetical protein [Candidatus Poribacteria bacterium]MBT5533511.1 hypothetical protein [Candidatus Poribacteria bacterium]MBT5714231.1 hypothetical protein [Candidatus Poribacteria bacterium]MBT7097967.1 hypothetical protein [Candidatus Poribacteria bacterium]MBT7807214.1 hypothetical protein [Candidatus Poribacteria bacterium]
MRFANYGLYVFCVALFLSVGRASHALPQDGLVMHYTFEPATISGDVVEDVSGAGNDGLLNGAKAQGGVLVLNGADNYLNTDPLEIRTGGVIPFTALALFRTDRADNGPLWMWGDNAAPSASGSAEGPVGWRSTTSNFAAGFYQGGHFYADAEADYADGEWHSVAQVGDVDVGYLYLDGVQISSAEAGYVYGAPPYFLLGARTKNSGSEIDDIEFFEGEIDNLVLYGRALTGDEILSIVREVKPVSSQGKLATVWGELRR